jgi:ABC-type iron transport system FetAB ATPase subunit
MSSSKVLEVRDLKRIVSDRTIITNLSFSVRAGEILFVRGASGVGKSLLLRALAYLDPIQVCL